MKKNILFFIISIIIILITIFTCTCINKYHILKDIYNMQNNLNKIENYSYLNNQTTQIIKKNNDIRVDKFDENITIYFDSQNNKLYNLDNNNMTMKIIDNGINHISVPLQKIDFINKSIIYNIFNTKITSSYSEYYIQIDSIEYTIDKQTGIVKKIIWINSNDIYTYTDYKFNDDTLNIIKPDLSKYTIK